MAQLRLIAVAVAIGAGCGRSEAAPPAATSGLTAPTGWHADGELAKAAAAAIGDPTHPELAVTGSEAWSEPSRGCFAVWLALRGGAAPIETAADQLLTALDKELAGVKLRDVTKPVPGERGTLALAFDKTPYRGTLRAELARTGDVTALACVWNQREPKACEAGCAALAKGAGK